MFCYENFGNEADQLVVAVIVHGKVAKSEKITVTAITLPTKEMTSETVLLQRDISGKMIDYNVKPKNGVSFCPKCISGKCVYMTIHKNTQRVFLRV